MKLMTVKNAAEELGTSTRNLYRLIRLGVVPAVHLGRAVRVHADRLQDWMNGGGTAVVTRRRRPTDGA